MASRDEMVIRPLLRRGEPKSVRDKARERAREERQTQRAAKQKRRILQRLRRAAMARRALASRTRAARMRAKGFAPSAGEVATGALRGVGKAAGAVLTVVTIVAALAELVIQGGRWARRISGQSERLIDATDADTLYGGMDESIAADLATTQFVEGNQDLLRIIGRQGRVNSEIADLMHEKRRLFLLRAQGADRINRDPTMDSPEGFIDLLIAKAHGADLKGLADKAGGAIRSKTLKGPITTGR